MKNAFLFLLSGCFISTSDIRVVVWDEQQPRQKQASENFLGNAIADHLKTKPDQVIFKENFAGGEWFRSGSIWNLGKGKVFYSRPGHETYSVFKEKLPLRGIENAVRWLVAELPKRN